MFRRLLTTWLLIAAISLAPSASFADEGMWLPDALGKLNLAQLKKRGFDLKPEEVYSTTNASLKDAIVQISIGGTGSFVSPEGLILTNHHVAFAAVTRASSTEKDYINKGFLAQTRTEEIPAQGYTVSVTQDFKDVTAEVMSAVKPEMTTAQREAALTAKRQEIQKTALQGRDKQGIRTQVVEATGGYQYFLYTYLTLRDVRLVYAPPKSIGYYGGDPDNFEWPRHCGDFAFLRAYTGADGNPANFGKENVPFKPKKFLPINATGIKEGDFAMIMGYPGATYRYRESYSVEYRQNFQLPDQIAALRSQIQSLTEAGEKNPALKVRLADQIFGLSNSLKAFEGTVTGLKRMDLVARKRAEEAQLQKWLDANPAQKEKYNNVLPQLAALYQDLNSFSLRQSALNNLLGSGDLLQALQFAYGRALNLEKPVDQRSPQYHDSILQQAQAQLGAEWNAREVAAEGKLLASSLARLAELPAEQRLAPVENLFVNKANDERRKAESEFAQQSLASTKFKSFDEVKKLFSLSAADLRQIDDPLLKLAIAAVDANAPLAAKVTEFNGKVTTLRPLYVAAMQAMGQEMKKAPYYPDANFTLRFTYGEIKGYKPRDAVTYDYQTSLGGVIEKDTGVEPFDAPEGLKALAQKRDFGGYVEPRLNDVPVAFLTTNDITGGNSGSAVMNGKGEVIGLAFDGNYEGLGGDYAFEPALNRTLAVDIRYVLFLTEKFAGANYLFNEMNIKRAKALTAGK